MIPPELYVKMIENTADAYYKLGYSVFRVGDSILIRKQLPDYDDSEIVTSWEDSDFYQLQDSCPTYVDLSDWAMYKYSQSLTYKL